MSDESAARNLPAQPTEVDYEAIHDAVMESQRGRCFLQEYAHRNRNGDTGMLLAAIERIESMLRRQRLLPLPSATSFSELHEVRERAKKNPEPVKPDAGRDGRLADSRLADGKGLVRLFEAEVTQLRGIVRPLRDAAYAMREEGVRDRFYVDVESCAADLSRRFDALERAAADILALLCEPRAREGANAAPEPGQTDPILARAVPAQLPELRPEPVAASCAHPTEVQLSQSEPPATPSSSAKPDVTASRNELTLDPLLPVVEIRTEPTPQSHRAEVPIHAATELPFAFIGSNEPAAQPAAVAADSAPELPITSTFSPADFMLEPAPDAAEPIAAPKPAPPSPAPLAAAPAAETPAPPPPETAASPTPAKQPTRTILSVDAKSSLAPILLLSDEEKIALFS